MSLGSSASYRAAAELPDRDDDGPVCHTWKCTACGHFVARGAAEVAYTPETEATEESVEIFCPKCAEANRAFMERLARPVPAAVPAPPPADPEF